MIDKDVALAKIDSIQRCLKRIKNVTGFDPESLEHLDTQEIVILNLQRAIQSSIDLAAHVTFSSRRRLGSPRRVTRKKCEPRLRHTHVDWVN